MVEERYHRQTLIKGWNQDKIDNTSVAVIGSSRLSDFITVDLLSMGFGKIRRIGKSDFFDFEKINPSVKFEQLEESLSCKYAADFLIDDSTIVVDATNDLDSKTYCYLSLSGKPKTFVSASCSERAFEFCINQDLEFLADFHSIEHWENQGNINSAICSAMVCDEIRKRVMPLSEDITLDAYRKEGFKEKKTLPVRILQIGAGATGTFSAVLLAQTNANVTIVDFDFVDESNLGRQFLFYDRVAKNKAEVLAERLKKYNESFKGYNSKVEGNFDTRGFDFIFCNVDNDKARYFINESCKKYNIPLINGGSSIEGGEAMPYIPEKTSCLDCQSGLALRKAINETSTRRGAACFHPSIITSNQIVGALMVDCLQRAIDKSYKKSSYVSGDGIYDEDIKEKCLTECYAK